MNSRSEKMCAVWSSLGCGLLLSLFATQAYFLGIEKSIAYVNPPPLDPDCAPPYQVTAQEQIGDCQHDQAAGGCIVALEPPACGDEVADEIEEYQCIMVTAYSQDPALCCKEDSGDTVAFLLVTYDTDCYDPDPWDEYEDCDCFFSWISSTVVQTGTCCMSTDYCDTCPL